MHKNSDPGHKPFNVQNMLPYNDVQMSWRRVRARIYSPFNSLTLSRAHKRLSTTRIINNKEGRYRDIFGQYSLSVFPSSPRVPIATIYKQIKRVCEITTKREVFFTAAARRTWHFSETIILLWSKYCTHQPKTPKWCITITRPPVNPLSTHPCIQVTNEVSPLISGWIEKKKVKVDPLYTGVYA